jgi:hypothetical protein
MKICKNRKNSKEQSYKELTDKQNKSLQNKFSKIPKNQRIIFVPHCLRRTKVCKAVEKNSFYICANCGACKISQINKKAAELNYQGLFILKGGRAIIKIIQEQKPKAVLGVACFFEGDQAFKMLKNYDGDLAVQFVELTKDGCADTDVDVSKVEEVMEL